MTPEELQVWTTFAAAALTGRLSHQFQGRIGESERRNGAVKDADAMLEEWRKRRATVEDEKP